MTFELKDGSTGITRGGEIVQIRLNPRGKILTLQYRSDKHRKTFTIAPAGWYCSPEVESEHDIVEKVGLR